MLCHDLAGRLMEPDCRTDPLVAAHLANCAACTAVARASDSLDRLLRTAVLSVPPPELQARVRLAAVSFGVARRAAQAATTPHWWGRLLGLLGLDTGSSAPRLAYSQAMGALILAIASWQAIPWLQNLHPVIGDVPYAMEIIASSPAVAYLSGGPLDLRGLIFWGSVGLLAFLVSEQGPLSRLVVGRAGTGR